MSRKNGGIIGPANTPVGGLMSGSAGGVWRMNDVLDFVSNSQWPTGPQDIENSCRFNSGDSARLTRTQTSGDRNKATFSAWVKRSKLAANQAFFGIYGASSDAGQIEIRFQSSGEGLHITGQASNWRRTSASLRDTSAWYHVVVAFDTTLSTASDRVKVYVNGSQVSSFAASENPDQDEDLPFGLSGATCIVGANFNAGSAGDYFGGYLAEVVLIDGQQLDPTSFGETDSTTGIWKPRKIGSQFGSIGDNTFYLDFKDSSNLGNDASGKNNDFTATNLASTDQTTDTCVENFITLNPIITNTSRTNAQTYSEGNTIAIPNSHDSYMTASSTIGVKGSGKWYWESQIVWNGTASNAYYPRTMGFVTEDYPYSASYLGQDGESWGIIYQASGPIWKLEHGGSSTDITGATSMANGDTMIFALDLDNGKFYAGRNGTWFTSGDPTSGSTGTGSIATLDTTDLSKFLFPACTNASNATYYKWNFGNPSYSISSGNADANGHGNFEYAPPSGYFALNTKNLSEFGG